MYDEGGASAMDKKSGNRSSLASKSSVSNNDNGNSKQQFGRGSGRRREYGGGKYYQESSPRKPTPQKSRSTGDKRPRSRGDGYQRGVREDVIEEFQSEYDSVLTSRKKVDLNHLLNFTYARPQQHRDRQRWIPSDYWGGRSKRTYTKSNYNKEQFLQANCQFIVKEDGDYAVHHIDPDTLVDWNAVELIRVHSHEKPSCPICLEEPSAAKITRCGHIYCWPCILHYLALGEKTWRKCPICYESIHDPDLKSVVSVGVKGYKVGDTVTMKLMRREKGTTYAVPAEVWEKREGKFHTVNDSANTAPYMKLLTASKTDIQTSVIDVERRDLLRLQQNAETSEMVFIEGCLHKLKEREDALDEGYKSTKSSRRESSRVISTSSEEGQQEVARATARKTSSTDLQTSTPAKSLSSSKPCKQYASAFSDEEDTVEEAPATKSETTVDSSNQDDSAISSSFDVQRSRNDSRNFESDSSEGLSEMSEASGYPERGDVSTDVIPEGDIPVEEAAELLEIPLSEDDVAAGKREENHDSYYFYQAVDGQRIYLHAVNARCLVREYGSLQFSPPTITGRIVEMENIFMSEELRKRLRYLGHLPLTSEFEVAELDLRPPTVSKETLKFFADDIDRRKRVRQKRVRQEKRWSKKIQDEEKRKMGINPGMTIVKSHLVSGVMSENRPVSPAAKSDDSSQSVSSLISPVGSPIDTIPVPAGEEEDGQQTSMSFAQLLKGGASSTPVWPKISSSKPDMTKPRDKAQGGDSEGSDAEEKIHTSSYNLGDAVQIALDNLNKSKEEETSTIATSGMTKLPGKKKKKQQKLLFTTSMARGGAN